jgi:beta-galactosidase
MGAEIKKLGDQILGSRVKSQVAMMLSYDSRFAFQIQPNNPRFHYPEHFHKIYRAFHQRHVSVDITAPSADLSSYKLVIAPSLHLLTDAIAENLKRYVQAGGILVLTQRSGVKDEFNTVVNQRLPGLLAELCGVEVEDYDSLSSHMQNSIEFTIPELTNATNATVGVLCDILKPTHATVVARYVGDYYAGKPAITINQYGNGQVVYIGAVGDGDLYNTLAGWLLKIINSQPVFATSESVEVTERWQDDLRLLFVLNHCACQQKVVLDRPYISLFDHSIFEGTISLAPHDVLVLRESSD